MLVVARKGQTEEYENELRSGRGAVGGKG